MRYHVSEEMPSYPICILVPRIEKDEIDRAYMSPFGILPSDVVMLTLHYEAGKKKTSMAVMKHYIETALAPVFKDQGVQYIACGDSDYFKALTGVTVVEPNLGYVLDTKYGPKAVYVPNYRQMFYDPIKIKAKIKQGMDAIVAHATGTYQPPGSDIIKFEDYPTTTAEIGLWLSKLLEMNCPLTIDIETFDLKHHKAGIGTISFAWNQEEGIAFPVDYIPIEGATEAPYGKQRFNGEVRALLREFFVQFKQKAIYHKISFDAYILIYQLFMSDILDTPGLLEGMSVMLRDWDDTLLITYLATNSCAGNKLRLKQQAQEYAGNYAMDDIHDITKIPLDKLLRYNLVDALSTWFVHSKHYPTMVHDQQLPVYEEIFKPASVDIVQMQLTGMPINMKRVVEVRDLLEADRDKALLTIRGSNVVQQYTYKMNEDWVTEKNNTLKKKRVTLADANEVFNPNSGPQLQDLLFNMLGMPVLSLTDSKQPSTDGDTIKNLVAHTQDPDVQAFLRALLDYSSVQKILTSFIPAMESAAKGSDGWHYMSGNFNLGGTLSGRLSSSDPNLQNLPASSRYAKLIKSCFQAPPGWLLCGLDFNSLEDMISAVTTKDPNKKKVYTDGYDGHSLRAFAYFGDQMPDIVNTVASINSIQTKYKHLRQDSKAPTFALTYQGTFVTLMTNCGFSSEKAKSVEQKYHELYAVSDQWVADKLNQASKDGYVTVAFGLRLRTPLLHQVIRGNSKTPFEAEAEGRTAGNALGQSWCMLNSRAWIEFMGKVRSSPYKHDIRPCAQIHDAGYAIVRDDIDAILFMNTHLVEAVQWQNHPDIADDDVKLRGELSIFWPTWAREITIPNNASENAIDDIVSEAMIEH